VYKYDAFDISDPTHQKWKNLTQPYSRVNLTQPTTISGKNYLKVFQLPRVSTAVWETWVTDAIVLSHFILQGSLKVIRCCANRRGIYDFLLALNSNLTCIFNRSWDITPSLHMHTPPELSSRWNWKKTAGSSWTCFGVRVPRTLDNPTINLNPH